MIRNLSVAGRVGGTLALVSVLFLVAVFTGWRSVVSVVSTSSRAGLVASSAHAAAAAAYNMRLSESQNVLTNERVKNADGSDMHKSDERAFAKSFAALRRVAGAHAVSGIERL